MRKVLVYSILLVLGLIGSQTLGPSLHPDIERAIALGTMFALSFIMIHVGYEFELDKSNLRQYGWDYVVAGIAASIPWILCTLYFVYAMSPRQMWHSGDLWRSSLLEGLFAAPTKLGPALQPPRPRPALRRPRHLAQGRRSARCRRPPAVPLRHRWPQSFRRFGQ